MKKFSFLSICFLLVLSLSVIMGCGNSEPKDKFVGVWVGEMEHIIPPRTIYENLVIDRITIKKSGEKYIAYFENFSIIGRPNLMRHASRDDEDGFNKISWQYKKSDYTEELKAEGDFLRPLVAKGIGYKYDPKEKTLERYDESVKTTMVRDVDGKVLKSIKENINKKYIEWWSKMKENFG